MVETGGVRRVTQEPAQRACARKARLNGAVDAEQGPGPPYTANTARHAAWDPDHHRV